MSMSPESSRYWTKHNESLARLVSAVEDATKAACAAKTLADDLQDAEEALIREFLTVETETGVGCLIMGDYAYSLFYEIEEEDEPLESRALPKLIQTRWKHASDVRIPSLPPIPPPAPEPPPMAAKPRTQKELEEDVDF